MANGYSTNTMQPARNQMAGIPQRSLSMILVDETTPNLEEIQSFPVIYRNGNVHIHQDPSTSQMYQMTDEFHSRIPQILAGSTSAMTGGVMPPPMTGGVMPPPMTGRVMTPTMTGGVMRNPSVRNLVDRVFDLTSNPNLYFKNMSAEIDFSSVGTSFIPTSQILMASDMNMASNVDILDSNQQYDILQNISLEEQRQNTNRINDILPKIPTTGNNNRYVYPSIKTTNQNFNSNLMSDYSINPIRYSYPKI